MPRAKKNGGQPTRVAPGGEYGQRQQLEQVQETQPLPDRQAQLQAAVAGAQGMQPVGLTAPSGRPGEPLSAGLSVGPGAGPSRPNLPQQGNPDQAAINRLARYLPVLEAQAEQPGASAALRRFVLQLRGSLPPGMDIRELMGGPDGAA